MIATGGKVGASAGTVADLVPLITVVSSAPADVAGFGILIQAVEHLPELPAESLPELIAGFERVTACVLAWQMQAMAEFARPGRAGDISELVAEIAARETKKLRKAAKAAAAGKRPAGNANGGKGSGPRLPLMSPIRRA